MLGRDPSPGLVVVARAPDGDARTPAARAEIQRLAQVLAADPEVAAVRTPFEPRTSPELVSRDGSAALILGHFAHTDQADLEDAAERIPPTLQSDELDLTVGGFAVGFNDVNDTVRDDLTRAELIAFPILALLLLLVFRGLVAAALPLLIGGFAVVGTFLSLRVLSEFSEISIFALNITTALGLGLAVDYGLLLVSRYREELERSGPGWEAHRRTVETAGRAIFFSGLTVAAAAAAMIVLPQRFLYSMGAGAAAGVAARRGRGAARDPGDARAAGRARERAQPAPRAAAAAGSGRWFRLAQMVMRRPVPVALAVSARARGGGAAARARHARTARQPVRAGGPRRAHGDRRDRRRVHAEPRLSDHRDGPASRCRRGCARRSAELDGVRAVSRPQPLGDDLALLEATPVDEPLSSAAQDTARSIRSIAAVGSRVGGASAEFIDFKQSLVDHAPLVAGLVATSTFILLFLLTGSVILPLKTLVMNVFSIVAAFGLTVLVFEDGFGSGLFDYHGPEAIETALLVVVGATTFGLATDYAVLVLARIKEYHDAGEDNETAVALGIERTGRVITAAAVMLAVVFLAFTSSSIFFMKEVGFAQAAAVLIDASIIRALLVPALMRMLGQWNWWAPRPLRRLHERLGFSEPSETIA